MPVAQKLNNDKNRLGMERLLKEKQTRLKAVANDKKIARALAKIQRGTSFKQALNTVRQQKNAAALAAYSQPYNSSQQQQTSFPTTAVDVWSPTVTTNGSTCTGTSTQYYSIPLTSNIWTAPFNISSSLGIPVQPAFDTISLQDDQIILPQNRDLKIPLPDGSILYVMANGGFRLDDSQAKVVYKASRVREFNAFLNASDLLAQFIGYLGTLGVKKQEVSTLPVGLFINWLIIKAAEADADPIPEGVVPVPENKLLKGRISPRCLHCQRFVSRLMASQGFSFCKAECASNYQHKLLVA